MTCVRFCEKRRPELLMAHTEVYKEMELIKKEAEKVARNRQEAIKKEKEAKRCGCQNRTEGG